MVSYNELGFSNTKRMFEVALERKFAIPGYNASNLEQLQGIIIGCGESDSPVIVQITQKSLKYINKSMVRYMGKGIVEMANDLRYDIPIALHLDHGGSFDLCKSCIDLGFSSVMFDGSHLEYRENVMITKKVVNYAHERDVSVEAELGIIGREDKGKETEFQQYTNPEQVEDFVNKTGCDSLAIAIGTSHGAYKFKVEKAEDIPDLRFDILQEVRRRLGKFPIVLHGASSVPKKYVDIVNTYGGSLQKSFGVPEDQLRKATQYGVCKINVATDSRILFTAMIRKYFQENTDQFDPRKYLGSARRELVEMIKMKNNEVLGSAGQARYI
ncbi:MAG: ketose-bisphosphate aldolase [Candidatus Hodarchaeota archaeon]